MRWLKYDNDHSNVHKKVAFRRSMRFSHCAEPSMSSSTRGGGSILGISTFCGGGCSACAPLAALVSARGNLDVALCAVLRFAVFGASAVAALLRFELLLRAPVSLAMAPLACCALLQDGRTIL